MGNPARYPSRPLPRCLFHRRNEVLGDGAAENLVGELEFGAARQRLHLDPAIAELPVAAGLLLVPALHVGLPANGLAIRNFRRFQRDIHAVALLHPADDDFHVLLAGAGEQEFARLRIAVEAQRLVFFQNRAPPAHAVLVVARFWLRWRKRWTAPAISPADRRSVTPFPASVSPVSVSFSLATAPISPAWISVTGWRVFPCGLPMWASRSVPRGDVEQVGVVFHRAGDHFEIGDAAGERVGRGLENESRGGPAAGDLLRGFLAAGRGTMPSRSVGAGRFSTMKLSIRSAADIVQAGSAEHRENAHFRDGLLEAGDDLLDFGSVPLSKNSSMRASLPSATISMSASCAFLAASARLAGISLSLPLPSPSGV
jgi:hypothetical protein